MIFRRKQYEKGPINLEDYIPLMHYPAFEGFSTESDVLDIAGECPATNTVTHSVAELFWSLGPIFTMKTLLHACPRLTVFKFVCPDGRRHNGMMWDVAHQPLVCPRDLIKALLEKHRPTLEVLHLDFRYYYHLGDLEFQLDLQETGEGPDDYIYPSLRDFERLSHMTIEFEKLAKFDDLPASLTSLKLQYCQFADLDATYLQNLAQLKEIWCPIIERVDIIGYELTNEGIASIREHMISLGLPFHVTTDGRHLSFKKVGYQLQVDSLKKELGYT